MVYYPRKVLHRSLRFGHRLLGFGVFGVWGLEGLSFKVKGSGLGGFGSKGLFRSRVRAYGAWDVN